MRRGRLAVFVASFAALVAGSLGPVAPPAAAAGDAPTSAWVVTVRPGTDAGEVAAALGGTAIGPRDVLVEASPQAAADLARRDGVAVVERDAAAVATELPREPCLIGIGCPAPGGQRGLRRVGAESAWEVVSAAPDVTVAVIDAGVDVEHPDLAGRVTAVPSGATPGCAALPAGLGPDDRTASGHGTRVAGLIAAAADGRGIAGVAWGGVAVRSYAALGADLRGSTADVAAAINCAIDDGADVINLSLSAGDTTALRNALDRAESAGVVVVAAAGNGANPDDPGTMPAAHPSVVAVTASDRDDRRAAFANGGAWVDLGAPGIGITSTAPGGGWSVADGTSYAAPLVTGAAALVLARAPQLRPDEVRARLLSTAEAVADPGLGRGLVDIGAAVRIATPGAPTCPAASAGWVLDAYGGLHPFGGAEPVATGAYWPGWDIARDVATVDGLPGGYVLDGFGGLHAFAGAPPVESPAYRAGWDVARAADRRADGSVVVLDGQGGLHVAGDGPAIGPGGPWFPGRDFARDVAVDADDPTRAWVLDAAGGVHLAGAGPDAPEIDVERRAPGRDLARRLVVLPEGRRGYVLHADGRVTRWAVRGVAMPPATGAAVFPTGPARGFVTDGDGDVSVISGAGAVVPGGAEPCTPVAPWPGRDLARSAGLAPA